MKRILWMMLAGLCCLTAFAQKNYSLKGKVLDVDGRAIGFANVALFRTDSTIVSGVTTGDDGRFVLQAPAGDGYLRISYVGYVELFLPLKNLSHGCYKQNRQCTTFDNQDNVRYQSGKDPNRDECRDCS